MNMNLKVVAEGTFRDIGPNWKKDFAIKAKLHL